MTVGGDFSCSDNQLTGDYKHPQKLKIGYNKERNICYYDGILRKVISVKSIDGFTCYNTPLGIVLTDENGNAAHGKNYVTARRDLIFKTTERDSSQYKNADLDEPRDLDYLYGVYRIITGACQQGTENFMLQHKLTAESAPKSIREAIDYTTERKAYRADVFEAFFVR